MTTTEPRAPSDIATALGDLFAEQGVRARVVGANTGAAISRYNIALSPGERPESVLKLLLTIQYTLGTPQVRIQVPVPGHPLMGIEVPNAERVTVKLTDIDMRGQPRLSVPLGPNIDGGPQVANLADMPHLFLAGQTGSGKSNWLTAALCTLFMRNLPEDLRALLIDPKMVEFTPYRGLPHLLRPPVTDPNEAVRALKQLCEEMDRRYERMCAAGVRDLDSYNALPGVARMARIAAVVDEIADLMAVAGKAVTNYVQRAGQKARASGIHLVLATQHPSRKILPGEIKTNVPARLAFALPQAVDSRMALDRPGAESLLGAGDGLYCAPNGSMVRFQAPYVTDAERDYFIERVLKRDAPQVAQRPPLRVVS